MNPHHCTFLDTLWPRRDTRWSGAAYFTTNDFRAGYFTALGEAQGRLDTLTTRERLALCWAILRHGEELAMAKATTYEAWCLHCCGGGKLLASGTKAHCERACTSHQRMNGHGHDCTILEKGS